MSSMPREALKTRASKPGVIGVPSSRLNALARTISSFGSERSAGVIWLTTSTAVYPSIRSAPTLKIWMTPSASVAMLEKFALLKIALCSAPALSNASARDTSVLRSDACVAGPVGSLIEFSVQVRPIDPRSAVGLRSFLFCFVGQPFQQVAGLHGERAAQP